MPTQDALVNHIHLNVDAPSSSTLATNSKRAAHTHALAQFPLSFLHTENFVLLDKQRRLRGIYNGLDPNSMKVLVDDVHALQREE